MELMAWTYTLVVLFGVLTILGVIEELMHWWKNR